MALARLVLLEDDASIRRFVAMALEDAPIELVECETVAEALSALKAGPVTLLITDLMLRDESGFDLLQAIDADPALIGTGRVAVFSAGLAANVMSQLQRFKVWRMLSKPASLAQLDACVSDALAEVASMATGPGAAAPAAPHAAQADAGADARVAPGDGAITATHAEHRVEAQASAAAATAAVAEHFGGDQALFDAYRAACLAQFPRDVDEGDAALAAGDAATLRRLCHSLRSVLQMIGQPGLADQAAALDAASAQLDTPRLPGLWHPLRAGLCDLAGRG